jgi:tetratricopeptide (TPR) repeat protein
MPSEKRVFAGFDELYEYLRGTLDRGIESVEKGRIAPIGSSRRERFEGLIKAAQQSLGAKGYREADDSAWAALRLAGFTGMDGAVGRTPAQLAQETPGEDRQYVSAAMTILGTSFRNRERHFDAVRFLERAVALDPSNAYAMRNLSDLCTMASPRALEADVPQYAQEIDRETELGLDVSSRLLKLLGVDEKDIAGKRPVARPDGERKVNVCWVLNNMSSLLYRRGRHLIHNLHDRQGGRASLERSVEYARTTLEVLGLGRDAAETGPPSDIEGLGKQKMTAAKALTFVGSSRRMLGDDEGARRAYEAALSIMPDMREAADNIIRLKPKEPAGPKHSPPEAEKTGKPPAVEGPDWWSLRAEAERDVKPQVGEINLSETALAAVDSETAHAEARILVEDKVILSKRPQLAAAFVGDADIVKDHFWEGLDAGNLAGFARVWATLENITSRPGEFDRDTVAHAKKTGRQYAQIAENMSVDDVAQDLETLRAIYRRLLGDKAHQP